MDAAIVSSNPFTRSVNSTRSSEKHDEDHRTHEPFTGVEDRRQSKSIREQSSELKQQQHLDQLKQRDRQVRAHETAHRNVGGRYIRGRSGFRTELGDDGRQYAVAGDVKIDTAPVHGDPKATLAKAIIINNAALAPADPSTQDRNVAAKAARMAVQARAEISRQRQEKMREDDAAMNIQPGISEKNAFAINAFTTLQSSAEVEAIDLVV